MLDMQEGMLGFLQHTANACRADGCSLQRLMAEIFSIIERKNKDPRGAIASLENAEKKDAPKKILDVPMAERLRS